MWAVPRVRGIMPAAARPNNCCWWARWAAIQRRPAAGRAPPVSWRKTQHLHAYHIRPHGLMSPGSFWARPQPPSNVFTSCVFFTLCVPPLILHHSCTLLFSISLPLSAHISFIFSFYFRFIFHLGRGGCMSARANRAAVGSVTLISLQADNPASSRV